MRPAADAIAIRRATLDDVPGVATIIGDALAEYGLPFEPEGRDADVATFGGKPENDDLVALLDGKVVGLVGLGPHDAPGVGWLSKLFVAKEARGRGAGRLLLRAAHDLARTRGYREVRLRTRLVFEAARALYAAEGYAISNDADANALVLARTL